MFHEGFSLFENFGIRKKNPLFLKKGTKHIEGSVSSFNYAEGTIVNDERIIRNPKSSYHASGIVRLADTRITGNSLRSITNIELLAILVFEHMLKVFPLTKREKGDIGLPLKFDESLPF